MREYFAVRATLAVVCEPHRARCPPQPDSPWITNLDVTRSQLKTVPCPPHSVATACQNGQRLRAPGEWQGRPVPSGFMHITTRMQVLRARASSAVLQLTSPRSVAEKLLTAICAEPLRCYGDGAGFVVRAALRPGAVRLSIDTMCVAQRGSCEAQFSQRRA